MYFCVFVYACMCIKNATVTLVTHSLTIDSTKIALASGTTLAKVAVPVPKEFAHRNVMIEVNAAGIRRSAGHFAHALNCQVRVAGGR